MFKAVLRDASHQIEVLAGQLRAAAGLIEPAPARENLIQRQDTFGRIARLRANLSLRSTAFRHAIRLAVCVGIGDTIGRSLNIERSYWLPMTVAIVLKPDFTSTFSRGISSFASAAPLLGTLACNRAFSAFPAAAGRG